MMLLWIAVGIFSMQKVPIDAVPDITNNQVQVITTSPNLGTEDIEQFVTYPVELAMANLPGVIEIRSISRFGLSVVTIVFEDDMGTFVPRQLISEKLAEVKSDIPEKFGTPFISPISTGLGEILQYTLDVDSAYTNKYSNTDLRTYQDWIVKRQMAMLKGVIEVNSFGGNVKQYEVAVDPDRMRSMKLNILDVFSVLESNNENTGGAYIVKNHQANFIRGEGLIRSLDDIEEIIVSNVNGTPVLIKDIATVRFGSATRYGAVTKNGNGETVGGVIMMLKGENSEAVINTVKERIVEIEKSLPEGIYIKPFLDRANLINRTTSTVKTNLFEGGLIVIFILVLFLGNFRGGLIVASTIPLSLLFAYTMMNIFDVWSNLMSLGAIDFGIIVDGAVIIVESIVFYTVQKVTNKKNKDLTQDELDSITNQSSKKMMSSAFFGQLVILIVFIPILSLQGVEGKMFTPMAITFSFAVIGAMILCLTYVPMISSLFMSKKPVKKLMPGDRFMIWLADKYEIILLRALKNKRTIFSLTAALFVGAIFSFSQLGGEFVPQLDEGDLAMHAILKPGSSLEETKKVCTQIEKSILAKFPEVTQIVSKIGVSEIPTDPMPMDIADMFLILKPQSEWDNFKNKQELIDKIKHELEFIPGVNYEFSQPLEMRFNELMTGVRQDVAIKLFGDDLNELSVFAQKIKRIIANIEGIADLKVEATKGLPQMTVIYDRKKIAQYGLNIQDVNTTIRTSFSGGFAGSVFEKEKRFDLVVRLLDQNKTGINDLRNCYVNLPNGDQIPIKEIAEISYKPGPMQISREGTNRRTYVGVNIRGRDVESVVNEIQDLLDEQLNLPPGYYIKYGGAFENLERATSRLKIVVPIVLVLIFVLLFIALKSFSQTLMIYLAIPLSAIGGVFALWLRGMPFSISAGVGFIVLFGVAVLNGLVLISSMNDLKAKGLDVKDRIKKGTKERIRPIFLTASTDILGFLPMAISISAGAEVQRPLATVVIGGMLTASLLTLIIIPIMYEVLENRKKSDFKISSFLVLPIFGLCLLGSQSIVAQNDSIQKFSMEEAVSLGKLNNGNLYAASLKIERMKTLEKSAYDIDKTKFGIQYGQNNGFETDLSFSVNQSFQFPTVYTSKNALFEAKTQRAVLNKAKVENDIVFEIKITWYEIVHLKSLRTILIEQSQMYEELLKATQVRYKVEEASLLEKLSVESQTELIKLDLQNNQADINICKKRLQFIINSTNEVDIPEDFPTKKELEINLDSNAIAHNPQLSLLDNLVIVEQKEQSLTTSKMLPTFSVGYKSQSLIGNHTVDNVTQFYDGSTQFQSLTATVSIPIWARPDLAKIKAAKFDKEIAISNTKYYSKLLTKEFEKSIQLYLKHQSVVDFYEKKGLVQVAFIFLNSKKSFEQGAIDYVDFVKKMNNGFKLQKDHLNAIKQLNQAAIKIEFLTGNKTK
jgi:cobalt-zinc-cadmium resistance protein CzcA